MSNSKGDLRPERLRPNEHVVSSRLGESAVLVHLRTNQIFELNATGVRIWELIGEGRTVADIERTLQSEFDVDAGRIHADVALLVTELMNEGLIDVGDAD
jgi:Coenzyme PQQ synthesis protein D (PqqD)